MMYIMRIIIFFPYLLLPLLLAVLYKKKNLIKNWATYIITGISIALYPLVLLWIDSIGKVKNPRCLLPEFSLVVGNLILMVPICLIIQFIFNRVIDPE
jgi:hypothetical protein